MLAGSAARAEVHCTEVPDVVVPDRRRGGLLIEVLGLGKAYRGGATVLRDVDLDVEEGERIALIGPNGAGKSTLLKCMVGLLTPDQGRVVTLGIDVSTATAARQRSALRSHIGFVFQQHGLVARASVLSNVVHGMVGRPGGWRATHQVLAPGPWREAAMEALASVGMADKAAARADQLSGGQAQRVAVARALVCRPRLLIADEPAASLDPAAGNDVMELFSELARARGITLVFTTHDMSHALRFADRVVALRDGGVLLQAPAGMLDAKRLAGVFDG